MKQLIYTFVLALTAATCLHAQITKNSESTYKLPASNKVSFDLPFARNIVIKTWDKDEVLFKTTMRATNDDVASIHQMEAKEGADELYIKTGYKKQKSYNNFCGCDDNKGNSWNCVCLEINHEIFLPQNAILSVETINGSVELKDFRGEMHIKTINGFVDVTLSPSTKADLELSNINGDIYTDFDLSYNGKMTRYSKHIRTELNNGGTDVKLESINGNIYLRKGK